MREWRTNIAVAKNVDIAEARKFVMQRLSAAGEASLGTR
jgi:hypothetical protein